MFSSKVSECTDDIVNLKRSNRSQLNQDNTELRWCVTARRQHRLFTSDLMICLISKKPASSLRDLGIFSDSDFVMHSHVRQCHVVLPLFIICVVIDDTLQRPFGNLLSPCFLPPGLQQQLVHWSSATSSAASRDLIFWLRRSHHITDALVCRH